MGYELTGNPISSTYTRLVQCVSSNYYDGAGNILDIVSDTSLQNYVAKAGDTMTGNLTINAGLDVSGYINIPDTSGTFGSLKQGNVDLLHTYTYAGVLNFFLGKYSGNRTLTSLYGSNIGIGNYTLQQLTTGYENGAFGNYALSKLTTGTGNVAFGPFTLSNITTQGGSIAIGSYASQSTTTGYNNVAIGNGALRRNLGGTNNVAIGLSAGGGTSFNAFYNTLIGNSAGGAISSGASNVFIGWACGGLNTTGAYNIFLGQQTGYFNTTGSRNIFMGFEAGFYNTTEGNLFLVDSYRRDASTYKTSAIIYGKTSQTASSQIVSLGGGGKVGINTITPAATLDVSGNFNVNGSIYADGSAGFTGDVTAGQTMRFKNGILIQVL